MSSTRVAIVGAGAMGCVFGARMAGAGADVTLVDVSPGVVDAISSSGIRLVRDGNEQQAEVSATTDAASVGEVDLVVVLVKGFHTRAALGSIAAIAGADATILTLQNGMGNGETLAGEFGAERVVLGVTAESGTSLGPGAVDNPGRAITSVGPYAGDDLDASERIAQLLEAADFPTTATTDIRTDMWKKLVVGASTLPAPALLDMTCGPMVDQAEMHALVDDTAREVVEVARALGHPIDADERVAYIHELLAAVPDAKGSMVQDMAAGRPTEIETINGAVVREADALGVPVPINRTLVRLVRSWQTLRGIG